MQLNNTLEQCALINVSTKRKSMISETISIIDRDILTYQIPWGFYEISMKLVNYSHSLLCILFG